jgi:hypothetical protein
MSLTQICIDPGAAVSGIADGSRRQWHRWRSTQTGRQHAGHIEKRMLLCWAMGRCSWSRSRAAWRCRTDPGPAGRGRRPTGKESAAGIDGPRTARHSGVRRSGEGDLEGCLHGGPSRRSHTPPFNRLIGQLPLPANPPSIRRAPSIPHRFEGGRIAKSSASRLYHEESIGH